MEHRPHRNGDTGKNSRTPWENWIMDDHIMFMLKQLQCTCYCNSFNKFLFIKICHLVSNFIFSGQLKTV